MLGVALPPRGMHGLPPLQGIHVGGPDPLARVLHHVEEQVAEACAGVCHQAVGCSQLLQLCSCGRVGRCLGPCAAGVWAARTGDVAMCSYATLFVKEVLSAVWVQDV